MKTARHTPIHRAVLIASLGATVAFIGCGDDTDDPGGSGGASGTGGVAGTGGILGSGGAGARGGTAGQGGMAGSGGIAGRGGAGGMPECIGAQDCDDGNECTEDTCSNGACDNAAVTDGTSCAGGECRQGTCVSVFACTEQGIRAAIAAGDGPNFFDCDGPTTVTTSAKILIDKSVILDGDGQLTVDGDGSHGVFQVAFGVAVELRAMTLTNGFDQFGGGIDNFGTLEMNGCTVSNSTATFDGGGVSNFGSLTMADCIVSGSSAGDRGGGIDNNDTLVMDRCVVSDNSATLNGGGIVNDNADASATVRDSRVSGNRAGDGAPVNTGGAAGIHNSGGTLILTGSEVSANTAQAVRGGGIYHEGTATITNCTISDNRATFFAGGIAHLSGAMTIVSSTFSGNNLEQISSATGVLLESTIIDANANFGCIGIINSSGYNIESPGNTCGLDTNQGDQIDVTAGQLNLGPLADNGGPTRTHALLSGSVAIDAIPAASCEVDTDQRGEPRPESGGTMCDAGAFEAQ